MLSCCVAQQLLCCTTAVRCISSLRIYFQAWHEMCCLYYILYHKCSSPVPWGFLILYQATIVPCHYDLNSRFQHELLHCLGSSLTRPCSDQCLNWTISTVLCPILNWKLHEVIKHICRQSVTTSFQFRKFYVLLLTLVCQSLSACLNLLDKGKISIVVAKQ